MERCENCYTEVSPREPFEAPDECNKPTRVKCHPCDKSACSSCLIVCNAGHPFPVPVFVCWDCCKACKGRDGCDNDVKAI
jgi:hypothetical protein